MKKSKLYVVLTTIFLSAVSVFALPDERFSYIENDHVKLGVITNYGATIGYFSEVSPVRNFVNYMDAGREIQQSYYGWADGSSWVHGDWVWNPVQGGSHVNDKPQLVNFVNENNTIYVRSHPRNWAGRELITDCFMEEWISLESNVVHITFRMCYSGPSNGPPRDQELPATFLDAYFDRLTYCNEAPWSYNTLTNFRPPGIPTGTGPDINHDYKTEYWSAYVKNGWGMGVYTPKEEYFGFYYVNDGSPGNQGGNCSHFSTIGTLQITTNFTYEYDVYLTIGMTNEIREAFYDIYDGIINPGFEAGNPIDWTVTGDAFSGNAITDTNWPSSGFEGDFLANSFYGTGGETATGTLQSDNFILKKDEQISFLIGGWRSVAPSTASNWNYLVLCRASDDMELDRVWAPNITGAMVQRGLKHNSDSDIEVYIKVVDDGAGAGGYRWLSVDNFSKVNYDSSFGNNCGFEFDGFSSWNVAGPAFTSTPESTDEGVGIGGWEGTFYACSRKGGEAATGTIRSVTFSCSPESYVSFLANGYSTNTVGDGGTDYNYVTLNRASNGEELDRVYMPGTTGNMIERKLFTGLENPENVYVEVVDDCAAGGWAWMAVDSFNVVEISNFENIDVGNKNFSSPNISVGSGSKLVDNWYVKGDAGMTNISPQISPLAGQTIFINGSELFQTFENVKLKPDTYYRLTFDSYSIGSEQTIKAGLGYGINSDEKSVFVAPIDAKDVLNVNEGSGIWLGNDFASGALFTNILNPSADAPEISHIFTFQTPENLDYTRISCDLGVRFWDASGSQIQLDNISVTNFPIIPEGSLLLSILCLVGVHALACKRNPNL